jgi:starch synthase
MKQKPQPFAHSNGIPVEARVKKLDAVSANHMEAKRKLQQKYFNFVDLDDDIPIFGFVGRITEQKGVHLICKAAGELIKRHGGKI